MFISYHKFLKVHGWNDVSFENVIHKTVRTICKWIKAVASIDNKNLWFILPISFLVRIENLTISFLVRIEKFGLNF